LTGTAVPAAQFPQPQNFYYPGFYPPPPHPMSPIAEEGGSARPTVYGTFAQVPNQSAGLYAQPAPEINIQRPPEQGPFDPNINGGPFIPAPGHPAMSVQPNPSFPSTSEQALSARAD